MPQPLPNVISNSKSTLAEMFSSYLLSAKYGYSRYGNPNPSDISRNLIKDVIVHKSFGTAFSRFEGTTVSALSTAVDNLADAINAYFASPAFTSERDFDAWEQSTGASFLHDCRTEGHIYHFGKAQKILNVTMKHLFCYGIREEYFTFCHMALDSMTYTGRPANSLDGGFYHNEVNHSAQTSSFSNLDYEQYIDIQNEIRYYLRSNRSPYKDSNTGIPLTPFQAEFYIWPRYKR